MATPTTNRKARRLDAGPDNPEIAVNAALDNFDRRDSKASISVTTTNITMDEADQLCGTWEISGLTAARSLLIDATAGSSHQIFVYNNSSYALTVKTTTAGSNRTVIIVAGLAGWIRHDNTHVDPASPQFAPTTAALSLSQLVIPAVRVYHSANQVITNNTFAALAFNTERFDTDVIHDTSTNNSRLTCKTAGKYQITGHALFAANATGYRQIAIRLGGATYLAAQGIPSIGASDDHNLSVTTLYSLAVNDYVELMAFQTSGAGLNVLASGNFSPEFGMAWVAP
jgi:hypothetical protein